MNISIDSLNCPLLCVLHKILLTGGVQWTEKGEDIQERLENGATAETLGKWRHNKK